MSADFSPCAGEVPEPLLRAADAAERRVEEAMGRLEEKLGDQPAPPPADRFLRAMTALIDADKRALQERGR